MSESIRLSDYLDPIQQAALDACSFVHGMEKASFLADKRTQSALVMSLVIMGEASTKVMDRLAAFGQRHAEIPWRSTRGMRNRIAHGYFEIDLDWLSGGCLRHRAHCLTRALGSVEGDASRHRYEYAF